MHIRQGQRNPLQLLALLAERKHSLQCERLHRALLVLCVAYMQNKQLQTLSVTVQASQIELAPRSVPENQTSETRK